MAFYCFRRCIHKLPGAVIRAVPIPEPKVTEGFGARGKAGEICKEIGARSVLLVTDKTLHSIGFHQKICDSLREAGISCAVFSDISSEPTIEIIRAGRKAAVDCRADCIVALGGGSVLDSCKIIAAGAKNPSRPAERYLQKFVFVKGKTLPMVSIPTTAGTGAEHTVGAVVKNAKGVKNSTVVVGLEVPHVVLDSELTVGAPREVTVWCGIDALSHGLEGFLSDTKPVMEDMKKSADCVKIVMENLPVLLSEPQNTEARQKMALAAFYGGNAINKQLAGYIHAFAHSVGALYHIPHGKAIAYCTLPVLSAMKNTCRSRLSILGKYCGVAQRGDNPREAAEKFLSALDKLLSDCGLPEGCDALRKEDYGRLTRMINADSVNYSPPKTFKDREIEAILESIAGGGKA